MLRPFLALCLLAVLSGCDAFSHGAASGPKKVGLALHGSFSGDYVTVVLDNRTVFADTVTTDGILGVAATSTLSLSPGWHRVRVELNQRVSASKTFSAEEALVIVIGYDRSRSRLSVGVTDKPQAYY